MGSIGTIRAPIEQELKQFELVFKNHMKSSVPLLDRITYYIVKRKGKQLRPIFVLLSAKLCGGISDSSYTAASMVELLHTATLVHDDVVDDAHLRRGFFSINALWKNKVAVLVGDYLLSKGLLIALMNREYDLLQELSTAVQQMSEGELLQMEKARKLDIDEEVYFDIINKKTASLIAASCVSGALSATDDRDAAEKMRSFGYSVGIAFQIKDDLFDYGADNVGKPRGIDIKEKKLTLPLIYTLKNLDNGDRKKVLRTIRKHHDDKRKVQEVIDLVRQTGGLDYARDKMNGYISSARDTLDYFEQSPAKQAMSDLVDFVIDRRK